MKSFITIAQILNQIIIFTSSKNLRISCVSILENLEIIITNSDTVMININIKLYYW